MRNHLPLILILTAFATGGCGSDDTANPSEPGSDAGPESGIDAAPDALDDVSDESTADASPDAAPVTSISFTQRSVTTVVEAGGDHLAFPDVTRLSDGRILLAYRRGSDHVDASGKIMKVFADADATTWSAEEVLYDAPGIDDRDPSVTTLADGTVVVNYFQYETLAAGVTVHDNFVGWSMDDGATFSDFEQVGSCPMNVQDPQLVNDLWVDDQGDPFDVYASSSSVLAYEGELLMPVYGGRPLNLSNLAGHPRSRLSLFKTSALGSAWTESLVEPQLAEDTWLMEPALLALPDGKLIMHVRTADGASPGSAGNLLQTTSSDGGAGWSDYEDLGFVGHAPELLRLDNGVLLSAFREINDAFTKEWVSMMYSLDDGATWSDRIRVRDCGASECGYPGLLELDGDALLIVYYAPGGQSVDAAVYGFSVANQ